MGSHLSLGSSRSKLSLWTRGSHLRHIHWHLLRWNGLLKSLRHLRHWALSWERLGSMQRASWRWCLLLDLLCLLLCKSLNLQLLQELWVGVLKCCHFLLDLCLCFLFLLQFNILLSVIHQLRWSRDRDLILHPSLLKLCWDWFRIGHFFLWHFLLVLLHHLLHSPVQPWDCHLNFI